MKVSNKQNFSLASLCDNEIIKKYVRNFRLNRENMESVYRTLLEIEDITEMSDYPELAQKDVVIKWTERRRYCIQVLNLEYLLYHRLILNTFSGSKITQWQY